VNTRQSGCREERRVYGRSSSEEAALELFASFAPYGPRDVTWSIEHYAVTERLEGIRLMTDDEVADVTRAEAEKGPKQ
jgi:hypothetical protein